MNIEMDEYIMYVLFFIMGLFTNNLINRICNLQLIEGTDGNASGSASDTEGGVSGRIILALIIAAFVIISFIYLLYWCGTSQEEVGIKLSKLSDCVTAEENNWKDHEGNLIPELNKTDCEKLRKWRRDSEAKGPIARLSGGRS